MPTDRFVIGTGRCGSTLLARMLNEHRSVVTVNEFLCLLDIGRRFEPGDIESSTVTELVTGVQATVRDVVARGYTAPEIRYPFGSPQARYRPSDEVPSLLLSALAHLTDDPDPLFEDFVAFSRTLPDQPMADHYRALFSWLTRRFGGSVWVERSGASIDFLGDLVTLFPAARFVHIHRDGHEAALSMRDYPFMRLAMAIMFDLFPTSGDADSQIRHVLETPPPLWAAGRFWCDQILHGFAAVPRIDADRYLEARFEDLVAEPRTVLARVARFLDLPEDDDFITGAAEIVDGIRPSRFASLGPAEQDELRAACRPGQVLLGRAG